MEFNETKFKLIRFIADGAFHSGSELAARLGLSRTAVWKQIKALDKLGLEVAAVSGKGYRLSQPVELLDQPTIESSFTPLAAEWLGSMEIHHQVSSTNQYLVESVKKGFSRGAVCLAEMQTAGKGRSGKQWVSPFGSNIYLSLLWRFGQGPAALSGLSLAVGVAIMRALVKMGVYDAGLKWPNDIFWGNKKLGGILIEVMGETNGPCAAVIGLGLNVYVSVQSGRLISQDWVDLEKILGTARPSRNALVSQILNELVSILADYEKTGIQPYLEEWRRWDCVCGKQVRLDTGNSEVRGKVLGITDEGLLIIRDQTGELSNFAVGEVSFVKGDS